MLTQNENTYTISNTGGWNVFCYLLADKAKGHFTGKTVELANNITVTWMAGSSGHEFTGTFDGGGHTLTVNYTNTVNTVYTAPFRHVDGATIQNLIVGGTISGTAYRAAGIIGETGETLSHIINCVSSVDISSGRYTAGFSGGGLVKIEGCVFNGKINGTDRSGGFIGYSNGEQVIRNSLFAPQEGSSISGGTFYYYAGGGDVAPINSYYTAALGTAQGKQARTVAAGDNVTLGLSGTFTEYDVSGITAYEGNHGIKYGTTYYAGSGDQLELTLSNTATGAPAGYQYDGYTASAGTFSGSTLTMPDADVTISVALTAIDWVTESAGDADNPYMIYNKDQLDLLAHRVNGTHGQTLQSDGYSGKYFRLGADIAYTYSKEWDDATSTDNNYEAIGYFDGTNDRYFKGDFDGAGHTISGIRIHCSGNATADSYQGIFGQTSSSAKIHGLHLTDARITAKSYTAGIVGLNNGTVTDCHVASNVCIHAVQSDVWSHGGIVGLNSGTVENCTSAATLTIASGATGCQYSGAIAGFTTSFGTLRDNLAIGATVPAASDNTHGAIVGSNSGTLQHNYYTACKVASENVTPSGVGCANADVTANDGAVPYMTVTLAPAGYGTLYDSRIDLTLPAGVKARIVTDRGDREGTLSYETIADGDTDTKTIPAGTAVMLYSAEAAAAGTANSYQLPVLPPATDKRDFTATNKLHGSDVETTTTGGDIYYKLTYGEEGSDHASIFGWYWGTDAGAAFTSPAHKAWLALPSSSRSFIGLPDEDETTGVRSLPPSPIPADAPIRSLSPTGEGSDSWHTLDGKKLNGRPTAKGLYINNGKKVIMK